METIETLMGCLMLICFIVFVVEYAAWLILAFMTFIIIACFAELIKWIVRKIKKMFKK